MKKLRDCTYGEIKELCETMYFCNDCPLVDYLGCKLMSQPSNYEEEDLEIDIPEDLYL